MPRTLRHCPLIQVITISCGTTPPPSGPPSARRRLWCTEMSSTCVKPPSVTASSWPTPRDAATSPVRCTTSSTTVPPPTSRNWTVFRWISKPHASVLVGNVLGMRTFSPTLSIILKTDCGCRLTQFGILTTPRGRI